MKIYLVLLAASLPSGYSAWKATDKTVQDVRIAINGSGVGRKAQEELKSAWDQAADLEDG